MKIILGIDPGKDGGFVTVSEDGDIISKQIMPIDDTGKSIDYQQLKKMFHEFQSTVSHVIIEKITAMPGNGGMGLFSFGKNIGALEAMIAIYAIPVTFVSPQKWMNVMHQGISKEIDSKVRGKMAVSRLFPSEDMRKNERCKVPHEGLVDALLIAEYGRLHVVGQKRT